MAKTLREMGQAARWRATRRRHLAPLGSLAVLSSAAACGVGGGVPSGRTRGRTSAPSTSRYTPPPSKISPTLDGAVTSIVLEQAGTKAALADAQQKAQQLLDVDVALMK